MAEGRDACWQLDSLLLCSSSQLLSAEAASTYSELNHFEFWSRKNRKGAKKNPKRVNLLSGSAMQAGIDAVAAKERPTAKVNEGWGLFFSL